MRFKLLPAPPERLTYVETAHRAVPLVPKSEEDCCSRLAGRLDIDRREARTWLTFLRGLRLARETDSGFARARREVDRKTLAADFVERQFGAREVLDILAGAETPCSASGIFEQFKEHVPTWEHHKNPGAWEDVWGDRIADLLEWAVLFGLVERTGDGYRRVETD